MKTSLNSLAILLLITLATLNVHVYAASPDLTVSSIWLERASAPGVPVAGSVLATNESFVIVANVTNLGQATAIGFYLDVYYDSQYGRGGPDNIAAGEVQQWFIGPLTATPGAHTTKWVVDPDNQIAELNEQNNQNQYTFTIGQQITTTTTTSSSPTTSSTSTSSTITTTTTSPTTSTTSSTTSSTTTATSTQPTTTSTTTVTPTTTTTTSSSTTPATTSTTPPSTTQTSSSTTSSTTTSSTSTSSSTTTSSTITKTTSTTTASTASSTGTTATTTSSQPTTSTVTSSSSSSTTQTSTTTSTTSSTTPSTTISSTSMTCAITYQLSGRIAGSSGKAKPSLLLNAQCSKPVGSYQFVVDLPLGSQISSVGTPTATGFMSGGSLLFASAQLRWFNLAANGGTSGNLTIPIIIASNLPSRSIIQITLNPSTTIRDLAGIAALVSPALPLSSNVNVIYPVTKANVYQALDAYFSNSVWAPISRVPTIADLYDLLDICFAG